MINYLSRNILYFPFFLSFIGNIKIPVGSSTFDVPMAIVPMFFILIYAIYKRNFFINKQIVFVFFTILFGFIALVINYSNVSITRGVVGMLPLFYIILVIFCYSNVELNKLKAFNYITAGALFLSFQVYYDFFYATFLSGDYYEKKLLIETWLGRSNYLAAFLLIGLGVSGKKIIYSFLICLGVIATMSRGGLAMMLLMALFVIYMHVKSVKNIYLSLFFYFSFIFLLSMVVIYVFTSFNFFDSDVLDFKSTFNRFELWRFSVNLYLDNYIFGIGPNAFRSYVENTIGIEDVWGTHNSILQLLLNYGFFGTLLYIAYILKIINKVEFAFKQEVVGIFFKSMIFVIVIYSLFEPLVGSSSFEVLLVLLYFSINIKNISVARDSHCNEKKIEAI